LATRIRQERGIYAASLGPPVDAPILYSVALHKSLGEAA